MQTDGGTECLYLHGDRLLNLQVGCIQVTHSVTGLKQQLVAALLGD